jgi:hypothetical protein
MQLRCTTAPILGLKENTMKFVTIDNTKYRYTRCDYRHKGKTKSRYILRSVGRSNVVNGKTIFRSSL